MMEQNGGNILWVRRAFGDFIGWMNAYNFLTYSFASLGLGYIMCFSYLVCNTPHTTLHYTTLHYTTLYYTHHTNNKKASLSNGRVD